MPDFVKLTRLIKDWHLTGLFGQGSAGQTDSTAATFAKRDSIVVIGLICSSNSRNSSRRFMDRKRFILCEAQLKNTAFNISHGYIP